MAGLTELPVVPDTNTPVQTPSSDNYFHQSGAEKMGAVMQKDIEPEKPLSPPNPSPSPEKHKLDEDNDVEDANKRAKLETSDDGSASVQRGDTEIVDKSHKETSSDNEHPNGNVENESKSGQPVAPASMTPAPKPDPEPDMNNLTQNPMPKHQNKFAMNTIKAIKRLRDAGPFVHPVDIVKLNIPFYYNYIKRPMDLSTIEKKLNVNAYEDPSQVVDDFNLMVNNCCKFNGENSGISKMAKNIEAHFEKHMLNMPPKVLPVDGAANGAAAASFSANPRRRAVVLDSEAKKESIAAQRPKRTIHPPKSKELPYDIRPKNKKHAAELRFCSQTVKELVSKKHYSYNFPFLAPVDTVALNIPNYNEVVKEPMDLGTIQSKLANSEYENGDEFERDVRLVFKNCYLFNPEGTEVNMMGHRLETVFDKKWQNRPLPAPTPPQSEDEYSDDDDEGEIDESVLSSVPAIQFLENQLTRMKQELDQLKKQHLLKLKEQRDAKKKKKRSKRSRNGGSRKNSSYDVNSQPAVTYEMKKQVSESVPNLSDKKLQSLIKIIKDDVEISNEDEVELDMDQLEDRTVLKLYNFLFGKKQSSSSAMKKKKKLNSSSNVDELQQLRSQLALFEDADKGSSGRGQQMNIYQESSEDEDDDASSESSEEE